MLTVAGEEGRWRWSSNQANIRQFRIRARTSPGLPGQDRDAVWQKFGYNPGTPTGPENWGKLCPECRTCAEGKRQSPINIITKQAIPTLNLESLIRTYNAANATITNDGHDITMSIEGIVGTITVSGRVYNFESAHWHSPSEHTINGQKFPLEIQLVHKSNDGNFAIIAFLYHLGGPDSFYFQIKNKLEELASDKCNMAEEYSQVAAGLVHLRSLQRRTGSYFRYMGSMTMPPCKENVVWNVAGKVRKISKEQVALLTALMPSNNNRPAQPLNGRTVQFYRPPNSTISVSSLSFKD